MRQAMDVIYKFISPKVIDITVLSRDKPVSRDEVRLPPLALGVYKMET
jgi:hypothetical protein